MQFGKYNLVEKIGEGGLGEVYFAQNTAPVSYSRELVVKRIHRRLVEDPAFVNPFLLAAEQSSFLNHHNIAQTFEAGQVDGHFFVAQEHIDGLSLEDILARHEQRLQAIPFEITLEIILQVCEALTYAYWARDDRGRQLHMVHRNLKPSNIMINRHGVVKVVDFGLLNAGQNMGAGQGSLVMRMAAYMSPEQAKGEEVDNRSDIFSLGAVFYELLTLKPLFCMDNPLQTLRMVQDGKVDEPLRELAASPAGAPLVPLLRSMLGASPWDRPTEAKQLIPHLRAILSRINQQVYLPNWIQEEIAAYPRASRTALPQVSALPPAPGPAPDPRAPRAAPVPSAPPVPRPAPVQTAAPVQALMAGGSKKMLLVAGAVLAVLFLAVVSAIVFRSGQEPARPAATATTRLRVSSSPPSARVFLSGEVVPRTAPFEVQVSMATGYVDMRAELDGYETTNARVLLQPDIVNTYTFVLNTAEEETGSLEVHVYPANARLFLNGNPVEGTESFTLTLKAERSYILKVTAESYATKELEVRVDPQGFRKEMIALDLLPDKRYIDAPGPPGMLPPSQPLGAEGVAPPEPMLPPSQPAAAPVP